MWPKKEPLPTPGSDDVRQIVQGLQSQIQGLTQLIAARDVRIASIERRLAGLAVGQIPKSTLTFGLTSPAGAWAIEPTDERALVQLLFAAALVATQPTIGSAYPREIMARAAGLADAFLASTAPTTREEAP